MKIVQCRFGSHFGSQCHRNYRAFYKHRTGGKNKWHLIEPFCIISKGPWTLVVCNVTPAMLVRHQLWLLRASSTACIFVYRLTRFDNGKFRRGITWRWYKCFDSLSHWHHYLPENVVRICRWEIYYFSRFPMLNVGLCAQVKNWVNMWFAVR